MALQALYRKCPFEPSFVQESVLYKKSSTKGGGNQEKAMNPTAHWQRTT